MVDIEKARALAQDLLAAHGLTDWSFAFDRAKRRAGAAHFADKKITLSRAIAEAADEQVVRDTILHEIAHALVGPEHHHDRHWREVCIRIGGSGHAQLSNAPHIPGAWIGTCPAGHTIERFRRPTRLMSCARCKPSFSPEYQFVWHRRNNEA